MLVNVDKLMNDYRWMISEVITSNTGVLNPPLSTLVIAMKNFLRSPEEEIIEDPVLPELVTYLGDAPTEIVTAIKWELDSAIAASHTLVLIHLDIISYDKYGSLSIIDVLTALVNTPDVSNVLGFDASNTMAITGILDGMFPDEMADVIQADNVVNLFGE